MMRGLVLGSLTAIVMASVSASPATASDRYPASGGDIVITPLIHASVQFEYGGKVIQVDPWGIQGLPGAKPADLILISDDVGHHLDAKVIQKLRRPGAAVVIPETGKAQVPDGIVLRNGESIAAAGFQVESIAAYDLKPGAPEHPRGEANGYVLTLGGKRILLAGVTECVPEITALKNIDIAFLPMNIPPERMSPAEVADCAKTLRPNVVYIYHYDQDFASNAANTTRYAKWLAEGTTVAESLQAFRDALKGTSIEVRSGQWYP